MGVDQDPADGIASRGYRWYVTAQVVSIVGTMMGYTALYWLALHLGHGDAATLSAVVAAGFGLLGTFVAVGGIAGNYYSSRRGDPGRSEFPIWALVFGVAECLAAVMPAAWAYDLTMIVIGAATQLFAVSATVYVQQATPAAQRGHALSAYNAGFMGFVPAGAFAVAGLAAAAGIRWALIGPGLLIAACAAGILAVRLLAERPAARPPGRSRHTSAVS